MAGLTTNDVGNCCCGPCRLCFTCFDCDTGLPVRGATVAISGVGSCVTDASGTCCITVPDSGSYTVTVSGGGYKTYSNTVVASCPATIGHLITLDHGFRVSASGCNGGGLPLPGATITIGPATVTTGADGTARIDSLDPGRYAWTASAPRMVSQSGIVDVFGTSCQEVGIAPNVGRFFSIGFTPDTGYVCIPDCAYPVKDTLTITNSALGTATITHNSISLQWEGVYAGASFGACGCPGDTQDVPVTWGPKPPTGAFAECWTVLMDSVAGFFTCPDHLFGFPSTDCVAGTTISCPPSFLWQASFTTNPAPCDPLGIDSGQNLFGTGVTVTTMVTE